MRAEDLVVLNEPASQPATRPAAAPTSRPTTQPTSQPTTQCASPDTLEGCDDAFRRGQYEPALCGYRKLVESPASAVPAAIGLSRALRMTGEYEDARDALLRVEEQAKGDPQWHVAMADALAVVGQYDDALAHAVQAAELRPLWATAILLRGRLLETVGRKDDALAVYREVADVIDRGAYLKDASETLAIGQIMDREAQLKGRKASQSADNILNNYLVAAYRLDGRMWEAHLATGFFALSKHRPKTAADEFQKALALNANLPDAHVGLGMVQLSGWNFEAGIAAADKALAVNPRHADALLLKAVCSMQWRKYEEVPPLVEQVLAFNPHHLEALATMAAAYTRMYAPDKAQPFLDRAEAVCPHSADLYDILGQWLSAGRQFEEAEACFLKAVERAPENASPLASLGALYMQTGEEDEARTVLQRAHELDDFRADVINYLNVLAKLDDFAVRETEHFIIKVEPKRDAVLLDQVAEYMEEIHEQIALDYSHEPDEKTIIEILPTQTQFSARLSGRGWIPTVGACTGRVIALAAPDPIGERTPLGTHNWAVVLRHEYTHAVTLSATRNRIPHWFTEACAVWQQPDKRSYQNISVLVNAVRTDHLFKVKDLDWGFIRPKRPGDRHLAYAQSEWILEYLISTQGYGVVTRMLEGFRDGRTQPQVFETILGHTEEEFDTVFAAWARTQVESWGFQPDPPPKVSDAQKLAKDAPDDPNAHAELAIAYYYARNLAAAEASARKALELAEEHPKALAVLATVQQGQKKHDDAIATALRLEAANPESTTAPRVLAQCYLEKKDPESYARAIAALELLKQRLPMEQYAYEQLAMLYTRFGAPEKALPNLIHLHRHTMNDPKYAKQVAEIFRSLGQDDLACKYYREVLYINPYDASVYDALAALYRRQRQYPPAVSAMRSLTLLSPDSSDAWSKYAIIQYHAWKAEGDADGKDDALVQAHAAAAKAVQLDASPQAQRVLQIIEAAMAD